MSDKGEKEKEGESKKDGKEQETEDVEKYSSKISIAEEESSTDETVDEGDSLLPPIEEKEKGEVDEGIQKVEMDKDVEEHEIEEMLNILKDTKKSSEITFTESGEEKEVVDQEQERVIDVETEEDEDEGVVDGKITREDIVIEVREESERNREGYEPIDTPPNGSNVCDDDDVDGSSKMTKIETTEDEEDDSSGEEKSEHADLYQSRNNNNESSEENLEGSSFLRRRVENDGRAEDDNDEYEIIGEQRPSATGSEIDEDLEDKKKVKPLIPFGIQPWFNKNEEPVKDEKVSNLRGGMVRKLKNAIKLPPKILFLGNCLYVLFFGWYIALIYMIAGLLCYISICCIAQGHVMFQMARYFFWPFNKYVERTENKKRRKQNYRFFFRNMNCSCQFFREEVSIFFFQIFFAPLLALFHIYCMILAWFGIVTISISKLHFHGMKMMVLNPLNYRVRYLKRIHPGAHIYLCVFRSIRCSYIKYSVFGMNIFMLNMLPFIFLTIFLGVINEHFAKKYAFIIFPMGLLSTIPLAYYIGKAVSSISAQSSFAVGAFFNALFGSLIELILYFIQLSKGLTGTVHKAVTGSLLGVMLLMPGLSMFIGGIKHRQQYFNKDAAGVSAVLLLLAISGVFVPTLFYETIAEYGFKCQICTSNVTKISGGFDCTGCTYHTATDYRDDHAFQSRAKPLSWVVAFILPVAYIAGLIFALKTHKHLYEKPVKDEEGLELEAGGHGGPGWTKVQCIFVLVVSTGLFAAIAEVISITMEPGLDMVGISNEFAGLTLIGIIPNFAEFVNAVQFSLENNIILSLEIGNVAALQISLLQTSALVIFSQIIFGWIFPSKSHSVYYLFFPRMDMYALFLAVLVLNYVMVDGRANYFRGLVLVLVYLIFTAAYFFDTQDLGEKN